MALNKTTLESQLRQLFSDSASNEDGEDAREQLIKGLATVVDTYVRSAQVTVNVVTTGSATTQTGTGSGTLT
jgi:hypothetical protein